MLLDRSGKNRETKAFNEMITEAAKGDATEIPVNKVKLDILLEAAANTGISEHRQTIYKALFLAKATDGTDVDGRIAEFATKREMLPDVREVLIRDVLRKRKNPSVVPTLMAFARSTSDSRAAVAALQAVRFMAGDEQFEQFITVIETTSKEDVRKAAEDTLAEIIRKTRNRTDCANRLAASYAERGQRQHPPIAAPLARPLWWRQGHGDRQKGLDRRKGSGGGDRRARCLAR